MERFEHGGDVYGNTGVELDFSVNINPLGMPEVVRRAIISHVDEYTRYPDPQCRELRAAIAAHEDVEKDAVLCGNGAADLIYRLCYALRPQRALVCAPTFSEYELALEQVGCEVSRYPLRPENGFMPTADVEKMLVPGIDVFFICQPNNPTGRLMPMDLIERVLRRAETTGTEVVIDECFLDFTEGVSAKEYLGEARGLVVLKAFTKMYAMAGLRLGYLLTADAGLIRKTTAAAQCWSVSSPAQIAGLAALADTDWQSETRRLVAEERRFLTDGMSELGVTVLPSDANFLLMRFERSLYAPLLAKGILIRDCGNFAGLDGTYFRIGVKTRAENTRLLQAVKEVINV